MLLLFLFLVLILLLLLQICILYSFSYSSKFQIKKDLKTLPIFWVFFKSINRITCFFFFSKCFLKILQIIIPQYNWGIFISAYKALILAGTEVPQFDSLRHFRLHSCYLLPFKRVFIFFYCHLICHHIFFELIFYIIIYSRLVISYRTYIKASTPKCSISIFIF